MPKNLTRHRRANKRGGQTVDAPYVAPAPAPTYPPAPAGEPGVLDNATAGVKEQYERAKGWFTNLLPKSDPNAPSSSWFGGRRRSRAMRGGNVNASDPLSLATNASPISGISSARAHNWVGGRTRGRGRTLARSQSRRRSRSRSRSRKYGRARR